MIGILRCGEPPPSLLPRFGHYDDMVRALLAPHLPGRDFAVFDAARGALPADPTACCAYVLTGSPAGVYEDLPWIAALLAFLRRARGRAALVGICFGHQAMAAAFGGAVEKSGKGWGLGLHRYRVVGETAWLDGPAPLTAAASHQDQVVACPPGARVIAASDFCPFAALDYGDAISVQFHPEFSADFATALIAERRAVFGALADPAIASYAAPHDGAAAGAGIARFLADRAALRHAAD